MLFGLVGDSSSISAASWVFPSELRALFLEGARADCFDADSSLAGGSAEAGRHDMFARICSSRVSFFPLRVFLRTVGFLAAGFFRVVFRVFARDGVFASFSEAASAPGTESSAASSCLDDRRKRTPSGPPSDNNDSFLRFVGFVGRGSSLDGGGLFELRALPFPKAGGDCSSFLPGMVFLGAGIVNEGAKVQVALCLAANLGRCLLTKYGRIADSNAGNAGSPPKFAGSTDRRYP